MKIECLGIGGRRSVTTTSHRRRHLAGFFAASAGTWQGTVKCVRPAASATRRCDLLRQMVLLPRGWRAGMPWAVPASPDASTMRPIRSRTYRHARMRFCEPERRAPANDESRRRGSVNADSSCHPHNARLGRRRRRSAIRDQHSMGDGFSYRVYDESSLSANSVEGLSPRSRSAVATTISRDGSGCHSSVDGAQGLLPMTWMWWTDRHGNGRIAATRTRRVVAEAA